MKKKNKKSQGKAVQVTVNSKEENSKDFCLDFLQEFDLNLGVKTEQNLAVKVRTP